jgi:hypothetical protein
MAHPYHHAASSAKKYGGDPDEYLRLHEWLDGSKAHMADFRHRALRHHSEGIFLLEQIFGTTITLSTGRVLPVRFVGEQHVLEDLGWIPTVADWLGRIQPESWMLRTNRVEQVYSHPAPPDHGRTANHHPSPVSMPIDASSSTSCSS